MTTTILPIPALTASQIVKFYSNVAVDSERGCQVWQGNLNNGGYGILNIDRKQYRAHRVSYVIKNGEHEEGLVLDHLCRNRACVNPDHLEPVTTRTNVLRGEGISAMNALKSHCPRGHAMIDANRITDTVGTHGRACRSCDNAARSARRQGLKGAARERFIQKSADQRYMDALRKAASKEAEVYA